MQVDMAATRANQRMPTRMGCSLCFRSVSGLSKMTGDLLLLLHTKIRTHGRPSPPQSFVQVFSSTEVGLSRQKWLTVPGRNHLHLSHRRFGSFAKNVLL